ncbi:hypothetical protein HDU97_001005 [Phlyctochytrium planicorne]|nr:hypothetical protein HDU97_001005 [Phlyctochytrium planicorne]
MQLDGVAQRQLVGGIFTAILALKCHHGISALFWGLELTPFHIGLWCLLDSILLLGLRIHKVPRLTFSWTLTGVLMLSFALINSGIVGFLNDLHAPDISDSEQFTSKPLKTDKLAKIGNSTHGREGQVVNVFAESDGTHILGSHIVHVLPPTIAKLNPNLTAFCIRDIKGGSINVPLLIKGTSPWDVELECFRFDGSKNTSTTRVVADDSHKGGRHVGLYHVQIGEPSLCRLSRVIESSGNEGKIIGNWVEVVKCPNAKWSFPDTSSDRTLDRCVDSPVDVSVEVTGTPPLVVTYIKESNKDRIPLVLLSDESEGDRTEEGKLPKDADELAIQRRLERLKSTTLTFSTQYRAEIEGPHFFRLHSVLDGRNNTVIYPESQFSEQHSELVGLKPDVFVIDAHSRPKARFKNCDSVKIRAGSDPISSAKLPVSLVGSGPWDIVLGFTKSPEIKLEETDDIRMVSNSDNLDVAVSLAGFYVLKSVSDTYCTGSVELPSTCHVQQTLPPSLAVSAEPIEQSCVGAIGALVNVSLTGEPPFWIEYDEVYMDTRTKKFADVSKLRDTLSFKPSKPGTYVYEFQKVGDATYTEGVPVDNVTITQIIHPQSKAWFTNSLDRHLVCVNDTIELEIALSGSGPWTVTYELMFDATKKQFTEKNVKQPTIKVRTPPLSTPGTYILDLIGTNSDRDLLDASESDGIRVSEPGTYKLLEIKDKYCSGRTLAPSECEVSLIPRPTIEIPTTEYSTIESGNYVRRSVCEGSDDTLELLFSGKAAFSLSYSHSFRSDLSQTDKTVSVEEKFSSKVARLPLDTANPGDHIYRFGQISDNNYKIADPAPKYVSLSQRVIRKPDAMFIGGTDRVFQCIGDDNEGGIQIKLQGSAPFELVLELKHENFPRDVIRVGDIKENIYRFKPPALNATGRYKIQLVLIQDASGCERLFDRDASETSMMVQVSDAARISSLTPPSVCAGDIITYTLQGTPPFTVSYDFDNGEVKQVTFEDPILIFYASDAGKVNIQSVCNQLQCCTRPPNLTHTIHGLPSAIVDGGYDLVEDIREGDEAAIVIEFKGEPPFSFTYRRTELLPKAAQDKRAVDEPFETFTVSGIESKQYVITTSQEGIFNVVAVHDKYCGYPRVGHSAEGANVVLKK